MHEYEKINWTEGTKQTMVLKFIKMISFKIFMAEIIYSL